MKEVSRLMKQIPLQSRYRTQNESKLIQNLLLYLKMEKFTIQDFDFVWKLIMS